MMLCVFTAKCEQTSIESSVLKGTLVPLIEEGGTPYTIGIQRHWCANFKLNLGSIYR